MNVVVSTFDPLHFSYSSSSFSPFFAFLFSFHSHSFLCPFFLPHPQPNPDLTFAVTFNLALAYQRAGLANEALNTYNALVKDKTQGPRVRINMGAIYFAQQKYSAAMKMYRMAYDQLGQSHRYIALRTQKNIGICALRMGQFQDAILAFEMVCDVEADPQSAFNLLVASYAIGDVAKMQKAFTSLLSIKDEVCGCCRICYHIIMTSE